MVVPLDKRITNLWLRNKAHEAIIPIEELNLGNGFFYDVRTVNTFLANHDFDVIHTNGYRMNTLVRICRLLHPCRHRKLKHLVTMHSVLPWNISTSRQKLYSFIDCIGHTFNSHTIAVSNYTLNYVYSHSLISRNRITTIYHGMDLLEKEVIKKNDICIISFLGRLSHEKGVSFLVRIIEKYLLTYNDTNVLFEICGDGEEVNVVLQLEKQFPNHVKFKSPRAASRMQQSSYCTGRVELPSRTGSPFFTSSSTRWAIHAASVSAVSSGRKCASTLPA